jgi:hypothetical protein
MRFLNALLPELDEALGTGLCRRGEFAREEASGGGADSCSMF